MEEEAEPTLHHWERKLLIIAFGGWAAVVALYGQALVTRIDRIAQTLEAHYQQEAEYRTLIERRLTILEQRQGYVLDTLRREQRMP